MVELRTVAPAVVGSNPTTHPKPSSLLILHYRRENTGCGRDRIAMDSHCVGNLPRITAGKGNDHRHIAGTRCAEDKLIASHQPFHREAQAAKLVFFVGIGAGDVEISSGSNWRKAELKALSSHERYWSSPMPSGKLTSMEDGGLARG